MKHLVRAVKRKATGKKPGANVGKNGGIYVETGPRGGRYDNHATVADGKRLPPTSQPNRVWEIEKRTPDSKRKG